MYAGPVVLRLVLSPTAFLALALGSHLVCFINVLQIVASD